MKIHQEANRCFDLDHPGSIVDHPAAISETSCCLVHPGGGDGYGASLEFVLGRRNFGRGTFSRKVKVRTQVGPVTERPRPGEESEAEAAYEGTYVIRFTRCPGTARC